MITRVWRLTGTAACFLLFGLGGMVLRWAVFPLLRVTVGAPERQQRAARRIIQLAFRAFVGVMTHIGVIRVELQGAERLKQPGALVLANHPSLIDVVFLMAFTGNANCIVKAALLRNPFTRAPVQMAGFLRNSEGPGLVDDAVASLQRGSSLIVFPEGTRTPACGEMHLLRGAARIAVRARHDVTPVIIHCKPPFLAKQAPWWHAPDRRVQIRIEVCDDILIGPIIERAGNEPQAARELTRNLHHLFTQELSRGNA